MLRTRILTALIILPLFLAALFWFPNWAWDAFTLAIVLVACHEWSQFCGFSPRQATAYRIATLAQSLLIAGIYLQAGQPQLMERIAQGLFVLAALFWLIVVPIWLARAWRPTRPWAVGIAGWLVVFPTWAAFLLIHDASPWLLLTLIIIVFAADIGAYFTGRAFGKTKLAPSVSPNKTWEGVVGGLVLVMAYFLGWFTALKYVNDAAWAAPLLKFGLGLPIVFLALAAVSVLGDLYESWMKRSVGVKDSGTLLPGHGGVLDRIDALTAALPIAGLLIYVLPVK
ncbi:MAG: phosphatidate cytidylyltransferase [Betaproteobacteria bacterium]|nr:phosphatidate cytidylyltransferase [Betaproteobacteria bacterium]